jgi:Ni/Fe-hydrogenase subunit HybB-like protein
MDLRTEQKINSDLLRPLRRTSVWFYLLVAFLGTIILIGAGSWLYQMSNGLAVAGIKWPIFWAFYITNFVFWIGISHAGTLISAILRLVNATWRRPVTRCAVFGPYFVAGAIFSGIAALIIAMAILRKVLHLEEYLHPVHFQNLGKLLLLMSLLWGYFTFVERLTTWYGNSSAEMAVFWQTQTGAYAPLFWTMVFCNFVIPFPILAIKKFRTISGCVIASSTIVVGMWLERFLIVVPSLATKQLPYSWSSYRPQPVEIMITIATFAAMVLLYTLFAKLVPIISVWELKVGGHTQPAFMTDEEEEEQRALWRVRP